ncbi:MAG: NADH-quinone oxidoreductase subunit C [Anaerolineaceae bacterium]|nr:NADH-quinone oxidoreductase subunit C [Anaerolineaceae bacterium]NTV35994.1 NADH-quinone oxidoreductase subunit C [Anaerolineaceae bacterium]
MDNHLQTAVQAIQEKFGAELHEYQGEVTLILGAEKFLEAATLLRDHFEFDMLLDETAVDYWPQETPRFHLVYQLGSFKKNILLRLRVPLDGNSPKMETAENLWPVANWHEREIWDMFGITFTGHSDLRRILMPADWEGHPLRKDYPLGYEEVQFTFNFDEIRLHKFYAGEKAGRKSNV